MLNAKENTKHVQAKALYIDNLVLAPIYLLVIMHTIQRLSPRTGRSDMPEISSYLDGMGNAKILNLGVVLGLDFTKLKNNMSTSTFLLDTLHSWLQKEDDVMAKGIPTWRALVNALKSRGVGQGGIAAEIAKDHGIE